MKPPRVRIKSRTVAVRRTKPRKKWREKELLKGSTPRLCGPDLIPGKAGKELI
jgi:hypothetical protein